MADKYIVSGPAVVLPTEGGSERYLYKGALVGEGFTEAGIKHALGLKLIEKVKSDEVEIPDGEPTDKWTAPQLKAYAAAKTVDLGGAKNKDDILAVLVPAK